MMGINPQSCAHHYVKDLDGLMFCDKCGDCPEESCMRINVYSQELTSEAKLISKKSNTGITYMAVQFMLHSSPMLHHDIDDDDRSAVTFWLPKSRFRREDLAATFEEMAKLVLMAPPETGMD